MEFLGHNISPEGVKPTKGHVKGILEAPAPTNKQELQSFLGMLTYNAKFLPNMSHTLHPLNQLLRKTHPGYGRQNNTKPLKLQNVRYSTGALLCKKSTQTIL